MTDSVTLRPDPQAASRIEFTALRDDGESTLSIVVDADGGWRLSETDECARSGTISTGCLHDLIVGFLSAFLIHLVNDGPHWLVHSGKLNRHFTAFCLSLSIFHCSSFTGKGSCHSVSF